MITSINKFVLVVWWCVAICYFIIGNVHGETPMRTSFNVMASKWCRWSGGQNLLLVEQRRLKNATDEEDKHLDLGEASVDFELYGESAGSEGSKGRKSFWRDSWSFLSKVSPTPQWYGDIYCDVASVNVYVIIARSWTDGVTLRLHKINLDKTGRPSDTSATGTPIAYEKVAEYAKKLPPFECQVDTVTLMRDQDSFLIYLERSKSCGGFLLKFDKRTGQWAELDLPK